MTYLFIIMVVLAPMLYHQWMLDMERAEDRKKNILKEGPGYQGKINRKVSIGAIIFFYICPIIAGCVLLNMIMK